MEPGPLPPIKYLNTGLIFRLGFFLIISLVLLGFLVRDVLLGDLTWWLAIVAVCIGITLGFFLSRQMRVGWRSSDRKAVMEMDVAGLLALFAYLAVEYSRTWIFGHFLQGLALSAFTLGILAGGLLGRFLALRLSIFEVLNQRLRRSRKR